MTSPSRVPGWLTAMAVALLCSSGVGAAAEKPAAPHDSAAIFPGTSSKEPISIDADKLVYYDKEHKAVYSGNVVVIQGDTKHFDFICQAVADGYEIPAGNDQQAIFAKLRFAHAVQL